MLKIAISAAGAIVALGATTLAPPQSRLVWNASESVPVGLYAVHPGAHAKVNHLVLAMPPKPLADYLTASGYLPRGVPLLKRVAALPGQIVCRDGPKIKIDNITWAVARERDHLGRLLPIWSGCHRLAFGEVFLLNWNSPASLDGRYFGPITTTSIVGEAVPLWTKGSR